MELTKKAIEKANTESQKLKEKAKDTVTSMSVEFKDDPNKSFGFYINRGELKFTEGKIPESEFEITITKEDFYDLMTQRAYGLILMATGKMKLTKGAMTGINKFLPTLVLLTEYGKKINEEAKNE